MNEVSEELLLAAHKLRALWMRVCYRLGLPCSLLPAVPENDRGALLRLRLALEIRRREKPRMLHRIHQAIRRRQGLITEGNFTGGRG